MEYVNNLKYTFHTHSRQLLGVFCEKQPQDNNFTYSIECGSMNWDGRVMSSVILRCAFLSKIVPVQFAMCSVDIDSILLLSISMHCHKNVHMKKMLTVIVLL